MTISHALILIYALAIALFSVCAWKLWRGQWLRFIAGNTFASKEELELPYQKRMAKEVAALLLVCDLLFAAMMLCELFSASERTILLVMLPIGMALVVGCVVVAVRASKASRKSKAELEITKSTKPVNTGTFGGKEIFLLVIMLGQLLLYSLFAALASFAH